MKEAGQGAWANGPAPQYPEPLKESQCAFRERRSMGCNVLASQAVPEEMETSRGVLAEIWLLHMESLFMPTEGPWEKASGSGMNRRMGLALSGSRLLSVKATGPGKERRVSPAGSFPTRDPPANAYSLVLSLDHLIVSQDLLGRVDAGSVCLFQENFRRTQVRFGL